MATLTQFTNFLIYAKYDTVLSALYTAQKNNIIWGEKATCHLQRKSNERCKRKRNLKLDGEDRSLSRAMANHSPEPPFPGFCL